MTKPVMAAWKGMFAPVTQTWMSYARRFLLAALLLGLMLSSAAPVSHAQNMVFLTFFPVMPVSSNGYHSEMLLYNMGSALSELSISYYNTNFAGSWSDQVGVNSSTIVRGPEVPGMPAGTYSVVVSSSQPMTGVMAVYDENYRLVGLYPGQNTGHPVLFFGPAQREYSRLTVQNTDTTSATVTVRGYDLSGASTLITNLNLQPMSAAEVRLADITALPAGWQGTLVVTASETQPLVGVLTSMEDAPGGTGQRGLRMAPPLPPASNRAYVPGLARGVSAFGVPRSSKIFVANAGANTADYSQTLHQNSGVQANTYTLNINPGGAALRNLATDPSVASASSLGLIMTGSQPFTYDVVTSYDTPSGNISMGSYAPQPMGNTYWLARLVNIGVAYSAIQVMNTSTQPAAVIIDFYQAGVWRYTRELQLPVQGSGQVDVRSIPELSNLFYGTARIVSDHPISVVVEEFVNTPPRCTAPAVTLSHTLQSITDADTVTFSAEASGTAPLQYAWTLDGAAVGGDTASYAGKLSAGSHTVQVTVSNACGSQSASETVAVTAACTAPTVSLTHTPAAANISDIITFNASTTGTQPVQFAWNLDGTALNGSVSSLQMLLGAGPHTMRVTATNACGSASASDALTVCAPPRGRVQRSPAGVVYPDTPMRFSPLLSQGTAPLTYQWTVDEKPAGTGSAYEGMLPAGAHEVELYVENACGSWSSAHTFTVASPPIAAPDFSQSKLFASVSGASAGDPITYIAILRNSGSVASPATFINSLPAALEYVAGSATASDGSAVTFSGRTLTWRGAISLGAPVVITYSAQVAGELAVDTITNPAVLLDSQGSETPLVSEISFKPAYTFTINGGALATSSLTAHLRFTYAAADGWTEYQLENAPYTGNAPWHALTGSPVVVENWELDSTPDPRLPRTVYLRYRNAQGTIMGPFAASILYDAQAPEKPKVVQAPNGPAAAGLLPDAAGMTWNIAVSDDNSGVASLEFSSSPNFVPAETEGIAVGGTTAAFHWQPSWSGMIYLRAVDRSGNTSEVVRVKGFYFVFLPVLRH